MPIRVPGFIKRNGQRPRNRQIDVSKGRTIFKTKFFNFRMIYLISTLIIKKCTVSLLS